jgi:hypothetical protein
MGIEGQRHFYQTNPSWRIRQLNQAISEGDTAPKIMKIPLEILDLKVGTRCCASAEVAVRKDRCAVRDRVQVPSVLRPLLSCSVFHCSISAFFYGHVVMLSHCLTLSMWIEAAIGRTRRKD